MGKVTKLTLIGIGVILTLWGAYSILGLWEAKYLAEAEEKERRANSALVDKQRAEESARAEREAHEAERKEWAERQAALARSILARNEATERRITAALAPKTSEQVGKEAKETLGITPTPTATGFSITVQEMQEFVALRLDRDRLKENLADREAQLEAERQTVRTLQADLDRAIKSLEQSNKVIADYQVAMEAYKAVAKKSKWRKGLEIGGRVGLMVAAGYLGARVAQ